MALTHHPCSQGTVAGYLPVGTKVTFLGTVHESECNNEDKSKGIAYASVKYVWGDPVKELTGWVPVSTEGKYNHLAPCTGTSRNSDL